MFRRSDGQVFAKCATRSAVAALDGERQRILWLSGTDVRAPEVLDWIRTPDAGCLLTAAVSGVPAADLPADRLLEAWPALVAALRDLHDLPVDSCPFDRRLRGMLDRATDVVGRAAVHVGFLPVEDQRTDPAVLLDRLHRQADGRLRQEEQDLVVVHGDACLPNFMVDPETLTCTGMLDLGRLGIADRYADLALLLENSRSVWSGSARAQGALRVLAETYGLPDLDPDRLRFYRDLDPLTWEDPA